MKKVILSVIVLFLTITLVACSQAGNSEKSYTWDGVSFTVKNIAEADQPEEGSGKRITVTIDLGEGEMSQQTFENNVANGKLTLKGVKPDGQYRYHMGKAVFGSNGFEPMITGEVAMDFKMDADYELNESDLVIKE